MRHFLNRDTLHKRSKRLRHWQGLTRLILWSAILTLVLAEVFWFAHWDRLLLGEVVIEGASPNLASRLRSLVTAELDSDYLGWLPKRNIFFYPEAGLTAKLFLAFPEIDKLHIAKSSTRQLILNVAEKKSVYLWCDLAGADCYFLDATGFAFAPAPKFSGHPFFEFVSVLPSKPLSAKVLPNASFKTAVSLITGLTKILADSVLQITPYRLVLDSPTEWHFLTHQTSTGDDSEIQTLILVNSQQEPGDLINNLRSALLAPAFVKEFQANLATGRHLDYLDLRFAGRVFYKFKP